LGVPNLVGLGIVAQCEVPLKRKRLSATLVVACVVGPLYFANVDLYCI
jgi:hypothetical protein